MPNEDDRFGDVAEQLKQTEEGAESDDDERTDTHDEPQPDEEITTEDTESETESIPEQDEGRMWTNPPVDRRSPLMRPICTASMSGEDTWDGVTRMRSSVAAACSMFDVPEYEGREFQDACLRVIADHGDEVALQILRGVASKLMRNVSRKLWRCLASRSRTTNPAFARFSLLFRFCTYCTLCRLCECDWVAVLRLLTKLSQPSVAVKLRTTRNVHDFFSHNGYLTKQEEI